jgi:outer membrane protein assembly factor BamB/DNA-directed RNA polymerase subunit RPC12/RpoP
MAIIKLVCQGCSANLDALDTSGIITCGYCGARNHLKPTVYQEAPAPPPPQRPPVSMQPMQPPIQQYHVQPVEYAQKKAPRGLGAFLVLGAVVPMIVAGGVAFLALKGVPSINRGQAGGLALDTANGLDRQYRWESGRPFVADLDGDGTEDLLGLIQVMGNTTLSIVAISGADWHVMWETDIGDRATMPEQPRLRFVEDQATVVFAMGAAIRAFDGKTGQQKWVANLPDKTDVMVRDGDQLWARSIDESIHSIALATGAVTPATGTPNPTAKPLRTDYGYDLIPSNRQLDLGYEAFADVRIDTAFCPPELLEVQFEPVRGFGAVPCTWKHGLVWASRSKGTSVPFLIGYEPATKQERWRQQLTAPGSLETIDSGFNQPRAEFIADDALISFSPSNANGAATIRRISMADGATQWETTLGRNMTENVDGMVIGKNRVYVDHGGCMVVLELATGKEIERLGGW